ncbi:MAG: transposase [Phoenicibacter congonensis]|uniref:Transposase n=1 Tax=Phoenicibacter congonensis TaxID=1944646 RepID=A0AA43RIR5_9ACTN|nr:transposase [Phoenicibacter congonensis]
MGRFIRHNSKTMFQNVGQKGHNDQVIFCDDEDRCKYLHCLRHACEKYDVVLIAYVLMSNHVHLILHGEISQFDLVFKSLGSTYVRWFNRKYGSSGTLWNSRFYSKPINSREQLLRTAVYVFNNPVSAGIVDDPNDYEWSNFRHLTSANSASEAFALLDEAIGVAHLKDCTEQVAREKRAADFVKEEVIPKNPLSDFKCIEIVKQFVCKHHMRKIPSASKLKVAKLVKKLLSIGSNVNQISRVTGLSRYRVQILAM